MLVFKCLWFGGLDESAWLGGHFSYYLICSKVFLIGNIFFDDPQVHHSLKVILNKCVDFDDPKEFDDFQIFDDPKGISIGSMDFDNPKVWSCYFYHLYYFHYLQCVYFIRPNCCEQFRPKERLCGILGHQMGDGSHVLGSIGGLCLIDYLSLFSMLRLFSVSSYAGK